MIVAIMKMGATNGGSGMVVVEIAKARFIDGGGLVFRTMFGTLRECLGGMIFAFFTSCHMGVS